MMALLALVGLSLGVQVGILLRLRELSPRCAAADPFAVSLPEEEEDRAR